MALAPRPLLGVVRLLECLRHQDQLPLLLLRLRGQQWCHPGTCPLLVMAGTWPTLPPGTQLPPTCVATPTSRTAGSTCRSSWMPFAIVKLKELTPPLASSDRLGGSCWLASSQQDYLLLLLLYAFRLTSQPLGSCSAILTWPPMYQQTHRTTSFTTAWHPTASACPASQPTLRTSAAELPLLPSNLGMVPLCGLTSTSSLRELLQACADHSSRHAHVTLDRGPYLPSPTPVCRAAQALDAAGGGAAGGA